jgi:hypothetical protein
MSSLRVGGTGRAAWTGTVAGRTDSVERVDSIKKVVDDQRSLGPLVERNPWNPAADRESVNGYDQIMDSLRTAALRRDAALAAGARAEAAPTARAGTVVQTQSEPVEFGDAYVREAIAQYERNSG